MHRVLLLGCAATLASGIGCGGWGSGTKWVAQPLDDEKPSGGGIPAELEEGSPSPGSARPASRTIGPRSKSDERNGGVDRTGGGGRVLGTFRNTYYDFPTEGEHTGPAVSL